MTEKDIIVTEERIRDYVLSQNKFWEEIEFEGKLYYRTFQDNVYEKVS